MNLFQSKYKGVVCMTMDGKEFNEMYADNQEEFESWELIFVAYDKANKQLHYVNVSRFSDASGMPTAELIDYLLDINPSKAVNT